MAPSTEISTARREREAYITRETDRGYQLAFAMLEAANRNQQHPFAESIGRAVKRISEQEHNPIRKTV